MLCHATYPEPLWINSSRCALRPLASAHHTLAAAMARVAAPPPCPEGSVCHFRGGPLWPNAEQDELSKRGVVRCGLDMLDGGAMIFTWGF